ncbi:MAG: flagellin [Methylotenera sp.]|nr:flagellin [Methylotenera sp.]
MASVINTNIASLNTQRNLSASQSSLNTSIQRLSSGLRINSSKDDAAGLSIANRMDSQIRGQAVAIRNSNDGISLAQTAEGALSSVTDSLQRMRELAVQSSNATNTQVDRDALNSEVVQLQAEIQRVSSQTSFNGTKLLDGSFANQNFQVGANAGETIGISDIANVQTTALGKGYKSTVTGLAATAFTAITAGDLKINGFDVGAVAAGTAAPDRGASLAAAINAITDKTGVTATADVAGLVTLSKLAGTSGLDSAGAAVTGLSTSEIIVASSGTATVATTGLTAGTTGASSAKLAGTQVGAGDVKSYANAQTMIATIDRALSEVNTGRAAMGAVQNRFNSVISNLQTSVENISSAKSRIMDADFAAETANLTRGQILQQAGTAMLAQANSLPNGVLALLRG